MSERRDLSSDRHFADGLRMAGVCVASNTPACSLLRLRLDSLAAGLSALATAAYWRERVAPHARVMVAFVI